MEKATGLTKASSARADTTPKTTSPSPPTTDDAAKPNADRSSGASPKTAPPTSAAATGGAGAGAVDNQYFFEDEIFRVDKKGRIKFGLVIETSETYSGDEDDEFDDVLSKGEVRIAWYPEGMEEVQSERAVGLADRTLMPGDVVRRLVPGKDTQRGYCRDLNVRADVKVLGTKYVIKNVMAERLRLLANWQRDSAVCLDSWVGSTKDIEEKSVLKSSFGARVEVSSSDFYAFKDANSRNPCGIFNPEVFYPGNVVVGRFPSLESVKLLTPKIPLYTNKKGKPITSKYTIESVYTDSVWVHWQCKALSEEPNIQSSALQQPNPCVTGDDLKRLKRLNLFESCMLQISDRNYLKYSKFDTIVKKSQWDKEQADKFKSLKKEDIKNRTLPSSASTTSTTTSSSHHFEKLKKKLCLLDADKTNKSKKFSMKVGDKLSSSNNAASLKERTQNQDNHDARNDAVANANPNAASLKHENSELGWVSEDDEDDVDVEGYYDAANANLHMKDSECVSTTTTISSTCSSPSPRSSPKQLLQQQHQNHQHQHHQQQQLQPSSNRRQIQKKKTTKNLKKTFASSCLSPTAEFAPQDGKELVTEALLVYSTATVVWQDGTIEHNIPSTQLYPIHHLDNHEFFPGDFVISAKEDADVCFRDYGVIQVVDHHGRTAVVKWFTTYTSADEAKPTYKGESEFSVYDLKDHPDFQYRPGTMVIRVANFVGEDATCTAGQIIDNYIDGRVKVWWVDGHISMCWPQDLFEVGQYDHADWGGGGHESEDSWETESENSEFGAASSPKLSIAESHILSNVERARVAIARLEAIFHISPNLQNPEVMRKLLAVYKGCRYMDRLLNTSFFHEDHFMGLIERVRKCGTQTISERAQDRKNRLFCDAGLPPSLSPSPNAKQSQSQQPQQLQYYQAIVAVNNTQKPKGSNSSTGVYTSTAAAVAAVSTNPKEYAPKVLFNISSTPFKCTPSSSSICSLGGGNSNASAAVAAAAAAGGAPPPAYKRKCSPVGAARTADLATEEKPKPLEVPTCLYSLLTNTGGDGGGGGVTSNASPPANTSNATDTSNNLNPHPIAALPVEISPNKQNYYNAEKNLLLSSAMLSIEKATEKTSLLKSTITNTANTAIQTTTSSQEDSGNCSRIENCDGSSTSYASSSDLNTNNDANNSLSLMKSGNGANNSVNCDDHKSMSCSSIELTEDAAPELVCVRLCALLKDQLVKCINELREKYYKEDSVVNLSDAFNFEVEEEEEEEHKESGVEISADEGTADIMLDLEQNLIETLEVAMNAVDNAEAAESAAQTKDASNVSNSTRVEATESAAPTSAATANVVVSVPPAVCVPSECFQVLPSAPSSHKFHLTIFHPNNPQQYYRAVQREHRMLKNSLPPGVWIRVFEDRMDLLSVMIAGPAKTPYEDGMFFFDIQLGREYPKSPPLCHYISYCSDRLNPNLYEDGKVCVSLLGTWSGRDSEVWGPNSTLLQVIVSIQGLILVPEPYFNEAGYEKQKGSQQGRENSRMYNEMVIIKMVQATTKLTRNAPIIFQHEITEHFELHGHSMYERIKGWMELSKLELPPVAGDEKPKESKEAVAYVHPEFPLVPGSRGFCLTLASLLETFSSNLELLLAVANRKKQRATAPEVVAVVAAANAETPFH